MKKLIILLGIMIFSCYVSGQVIVDYLLKARALTSEGHPDMAMMELTKAIQTLKDSRLYLERAEVCMIKGDYSGAISDYNEANKVSTNSGEYGLSRIYALKGDARTAIYHLEMNLNSEFKKGEKEILIDPAFGAIENRPEWRLFWKKDRYTDIERKMSEIEYYAGAVKINEARSVLSDLKKTYNNTDEVLYSEALINFASGKADETVRIVSGLIGQYPSNEKYLRLLARAQKDSSNPAGASVTYSILLESGVADAELLLLRAESYRKTGENEKALVDIEKYLEYYPGDKAALSLAGKTESVTGDNFKALEIFSKNLKLHPNDPECYVERGNAYSISKSWDWAVNDYSMSLDLSPGNPEVWLNKGIALLNSGRLQDACHDFRKALNLGNKKASEYISRNCIR